MNLRNFCILMFQHCPLFSGFDREHFIAAFDHFLQYKIRVPVRGAILLNDAMDQVVLVKGWKKGANWSFPRGKINKDEDDLDCAVREVAEETGFDIKEACLVTDQTDTDFIDVLMREQHMRLYCIRNVPMNTHFEPRTRKEISKISWYRLSDLPTMKKQKNQHGGDDVMRANKFYMVAPFLGKLRQWISRQKYDDKQVAAAGHLLPQPAYDEAEVSGQDEAFARQTSAKFNVASAEEGHLDRLLAGLGNPRPVLESTVIPELPASSTQLDPAADLKRLLSVGAPPVPAHHPSQAMPQANNLLNMLRNSSAPAPQPYMRPSGNNGHPPQTPMEQIFQYPPQATTPHHQHPRPPPFSSLPPPPDFPYSPAHGPRNGHVRMPSLEPKIEIRHGHQWEGKLLKQRLHEPEYQHRPPMYQGPPPQFPNMGPPPLYPNLSHPRQFPDAGPPRLLQQGGPQQQAQPGQIPSQGPAVPPASKLPMPNLNEQKMGLLNIFKSPAAQTVESNVQQHGRDSSNITAMPGQTARNGPLANQINVADLLRPKGAALASNALPMSAKPERRSSLVPASIMPSKPQTKQQSDLLNLFRAPSTQRSAGQAKPSQAVEPVELAAQPSPAIISQQQSRKPPIDTAFASRKEFSSTVNVSPSEKAGTTSATVKGPLNAPNFETINHVHRPKVAELGNGHASKPISATRQQPPVTILSRPQNAGYGQPAQRMPQPPEAPLSTRNVAPTTIMQAPKPFNAAHQPEILRRPSHLGTGMQPAPLQTLHTEPQEQKNKLLGLFGTSSKPSSKPSLSHSPNVVSPISPMPSKRGSMDMPRGSMDASRSRISSITSFVTNDGVTHSQEFPDPMSLSGGLTSNMRTTSRKGSVAASTVRGSAPSTPIDKSFLLGFLSNVAKEAR